MRETIDRQQLQRELSRDEDRPVLIEVLGEKDYRDFHLPGALNAPLQDGFETRIQQLVPDKETRVVVYCRDEDCTASPAAAKKMEEIGYHNVADYAAGKMDWKAADLPVES